MAFPNANPFAFRLQRRLVALFLRKVHTRSCDKVFQSCIALHVLLLASIFLHWSIDNQMSIDIHGMPSMSDVTKTLIELVRTRALRHGTFRLASGREAHFYLDAKQVILEAQGSTLVGQAILERLLAVGPLPHAVGGMSIGADPVTSAVVTMAGVLKYPLLGFLVRKQPKDHGTARCIEGPVQSGQRVVIVEDVVTTGGSSLLAIDRAIEFGLIVERVITLIDRLAGGREAITARGIHFDSIMTIRDLGLEPLAE